MHNASRDRPGKTAIITRKCLENAAPAMLRNGAWQLGLSRKSALAGGQNVFP